MSLLALLSSNVSARDTMGMEVGLNYHSLDAEKVNQNDTLEVREAQTNQNLNIDFYALIDFGDDEGFFIGPYASVSLSNNGENPMNYSEVTDYAPYSAGLMIRYEVDDMSMFGDFNFHLKTGYAKTKIGDRKARGLDIAFGASYEINNNWNIGVQARTYQLEYTKSGTETDANINSIGIFISYDIF